MGKIKQPTSVSIVEEFMSGVNDYVTLTHVCEATRVDTCHASAALHHLKKHKAVECFESGGRLWWFSTPDSHTRIRKIKERTPESKRRRSRHTKKGACA